MKQILIRSLFVFILTFAIYGSVLADAAPPANPPASSIQPNGLTKVRMMSEVVVINVPTVNSDRVDVTADFRMKNLGSVDEQMQVRFPLEEPNGYGDGYGRHPLYEDVVVKVNGRVVVTKRINEPLDSSVAHPRPIEWVTFGVTFPVGAETLIIVSYKSPPLNDAYNRWQISYIFETGVGWYDTIGSAIVILKMPYPIEKNVNVIDSYWWESDSEPISVANELHWYRVNFEPKQSDNLKLEIIAPVQWQKVLEKYKNLQSNPQDAQSWTDLSKMYVGLAEYSKYNFHHNLFRLGKNSLRRAISLRPDDASLRLDYAEIIVRDDIICGSYYLSGICQFRYFGYIQEAIDEIKFAVKLDPASKSRADFLFGLIANAYYESTGQRISMSDGVITLAPTFIPTFYLTPTPFVTPSFTPASTLVPIPAQSPSLASLPTPTSASAITETSNTLWLFGFGVAVIVLIGVGLIVLRKM